MKLLEPELSGRVPFSVTSRTQGFAAPEIGVIQDLRPVGVPGAFGLGLAGLSGLGAEYRGRAPEGNPLNNVSGEYMVLGINAAMVAVYYVGTGPTWRYGDCSRQPQ